MKILKTILILALFFVIAECCTGESVNSFSELLSSDSSDEMNDAAKGIASFGKEGIPILLHALTKSLENPFTSANYSRSNICIKFLHDLARAGIFIIEEVPILIEALKKQPHIEDTYLTAETLRLITGVDPGYSKEFVNKYSTGDEDARQEKIMQWQRWLENK